MKYDKIEDNQVYKEVIDKAGKEALIYIERLENNECKNSLYFWKIKTQILKEKYNLDWESPEKINPHILFD
ncbi:MAG: hypothetical protein RR922_03395 [Clostridia bacterium]